MKTFILFLLVAVTLSCSADDEGIEDRQLTGEYYLIEVDCFCGFDEAIDLADFKVNFQGATNKVSFENPTDSYFYLAESGTYDDALDENILLVEGAEPYTFEIKGDKLILTRIDDPTIADDELVLTYQKM